MIKTKDLYVMLLKYRWKIEMVKEIDSDYRIRMINNTGRHYCSANLKGMKNGTK